MRSHLLKLGKLFEKSSSVSAKSGTVKRISNGVATIATSDGLRDFSIPSNLTLKAGDVVAYSTTILSKKSSGSNVRTYYV